ncbi:2-oxo-4-hydroxy-4-carboxy-5-ureidoimidazoline decarboxylase [Rothia uropygialis]|uniref:2-oxo-4-hydroxy-4-carboxy-5-ureidoimidazoline decarboxylase n=1 Tax=Kocuria sp. 36 TaxID=1415402 RepID=UPI00101D9C1A|nr:2-oxo-4-hydroxy-4-carboxy-5-ureidoimidazoline decarboxylase [Kocuria sp. 36]
MRLAEFNEIDPVTARATITPALGIPRWVEEVAAGRPYGSVAEAIDVARDAAHPFTDAEIDLALSHHPKIGERDETQSEEAKHSRSEQAGLGEAPASTLEALAAGNRVYENRFGHVFLIRAAGRSHEEILSELHRRLNNSPKAERTEVAEQLRDIAALRIEGILS